MTLQRCLHSQVALTSADRFSQSHIGCLTFKRLHAGFQSIDLLRQCLNRNFRHVLSPFICGELPNERQPITPTIHIIRTAARAKEAGPFFWWKGSWGTPPSTVFSPPGFGENFCRDTVGTAVVPGD